MNTIAGLPTVSTPSPTAVTPIMQGGVTGKITLADLIKAIPAATLVASGLMSAADKQALDNANALLNAIVDGPTVAVVEATPTITIPAGADVITVVGNSDIQVVLGGVEFKKYVFYRADGPPINVLGSPLPPQGALVFLRTP
jgi:hypothetical protein